MKIIGSLVWKTGQWLIILNIKLAAACGSGKKGQRENTIIIFLSDHGDMLGDHGMYMQGAYFYDEMVHVPLIINLPAKMARNVKSNALVELTAEKFVNP